MSPQHAPASHIAVPCACGKRLSFPKAHVGQPAPCPSCKNLIYVVADGELSAVHDAVFRLTLASDSPNKQKHFFLVGDSPLLVGKLAQANLQLVGSQVSRKHCRLIPTESGWCVEDAGSTNGVFINGERVKSQQLSDGDTIQIGDFELHYTDTKSARARAAAGDRDEGLKEDGTFGVSAVVEAPPRDLEQEAALIGKGRKASDQTKNAKKPVCPSCAKELAWGAKICVECGVDVKTGRSLLTSEDTNLDRIYVTAEKFIRVFSWFSWLGIYPIASEAFGTRKPHFIRAVAVLTIMTSIVFLAYGYSSSPSMRSAKNLMLWSGDAEPDPDMLGFLYFFTSFGDSAAFERAMESAETIESESSYEEAVLAAHKSLPPEQQAIGQYHGYQLITHAFLHAGLGHLFGNLLFLLVFGSRVNALIGSIATMVLYPIFAIGAGVAHLLSQAGQSPAPMLGASGAIMGLAGLYFVLFPVHKVHMAAWIRPWFILRFRLSLVLWAVRGFWVVLTYIAMDVFYTALGAEDGTAHWAHLGGFIVGVAVGLLLLCFRLVNARGGDLLSGLLGRHAWALIGKPTNDPGLLQRLP